MQCEITFLQIPIYVCMLHVATIKLNGLSTLAHRKTNIFSQLNFPPYSQTINISHVVNSKRFLPALMGSLSVNKALELVFNEGINILKINQGVKNKLFTYEVKTHRVLQSYYIQHLVASKKVSCCAITVSVRSCAIINRTYATRSIYIIFISRVCMIGCYRAGINC